MSWTILKSVEDQSVNFVKQANDSGFFEARYVQRIPEYFITYLSSHSGCNKSCRFCHLTATKQTMMTPATLQDYLDQGKQVLSYYKEEKQSAIQTEKFVNFNFMSRGEPLANNVVLHDSRKLFDLLHNEADELNLTPRFMISSIIPEDFNSSLLNIFKDERSTLYYSLYSTNDKFRKRWLPKAMDCYRSLDMIADMQVKTGREIAIHWAFIENANDSEEDLHNTMVAVLSRGIKARFNLVRYNPYNDRYGNEPSEVKLNELFDIVKSYIPNTLSKIVPRVGHDVKASCGMFIDCKTL